MDQPTAEAALRRLDQLVGHWRLLTSGPDDEPWPGEGHARIEWHESRAHLVVHSAVDAPGVPTSIAIIGCDGAKGTYYQLYSDDRGVCRVYEMSLDEREWRLWREGLPFPQRFTGRFTDDSQRIVGRWEKAEDGREYATDFSLTYIRTE